MMDHAQRHPFEYQQPTPEQVERLQRVRAAYKVLHTVLLTEIPSCRDLSIALTELENSSMRANKAIVWTEASDLYHTHSMPPLPAYMTTAADMKAVPDE